MNATRLATPGHPVVGALHAMVPAYDFGTGFLGYWTDTMHGLAKVDGDRIDLLVIIAHRPGRGDCGRFLAALMAAYSTIVVHETYSDELAAMLLRRGFVETHDVGGEHCYNPAYYWPATASVA